MKKLKKIKLSSMDLDKNINSVNEFLSKKGMSAIIGGGYDTWGNSNYSETTYVRRS